MKKCDGFTLIELMVAMGVIAILASIATPNVISWMGNAKVSSASRQVLSSIQDARVHSIRVNATTEVEFSETGDSYITRKWNPESEEWSVQTYTLPAGLQVAAAFGTSGRLLSYNGRGLPISKGSATLSNDSGRDIKISVSFNGSSRIAND